MISQDIYDHNLKLSGHRASEHLYTIKSLVSLYQKQKNALIISMWDLKTFFDSESLLDCMSELYKNNIKGKVYRLLFEMNKNIRIQIQTPVGLTEARDTGPTVGPDCHFVVIWNLTLISLSK